MLRRIFYTISQALKQRKALSAFNRCRLPSTLDLSPSQLVEEGVKTLVFDIDGVLTPHGAELDDPKIEHLLKESSVLFDKSHLYLLSNNPTNKRKQYFEKAYPGISFIKASKKKPYPDGLLKIIALSGVLPQEVMLIDDRLLTGGLAACLANTKVLIVENPLMNVKQNPLTEIFFYSLRVIERSLF